jgi:hypothetical protein
VGPGRPSANQKEQVPGVEHIGVTVFCVVLFWQEVLFVLTTYMALLHKIVMTCGVAASAMPLATNVPEGVFQAY